MRGGVRRWAERSARRDTGCTMDVSLEGRVALVTGAGPNIGSGIALALARYGAKVACNDLDLEASKAAVRRISRNGGEGLALSGGGRGGSDGPGDHAPGVRAGGGRERGG